ncbi:SDR family oxidoreductase [Desulfobacula sp.]|uniref:SDR family oxidoreductase n=1 Tax=Desulfobacula sp. TaxID=2593537 RepID=UPI00261BC087|nr:SDR family oxidoreductase [Desulfobacula sp.]
MELNLTNKVVMIAAASKGMGYAIARQCAREGAQVSMASRSKKQIEAAAERIRKETSSHVTPFVFDAADGDSIERWTADTLKTYGRINGLLVNAGGPPTGLFDQFDDKDWQAAFDLTLMSAVRMMRSVIPSMKQQGGGSILTITSSSVKEPIDVLILSNVMRSGVTSLVKSLSQQLAKDKIRVNNIIPGFIDTQRLSAIDAQAASQFGITLEQRREQVASTIPWKRYGKPEEFAKAATFLLSEAASYITGVSLSVDGGRMKTVW